jgi:hypothetical protein
MTENHMAGADPVAKARLIAFYLPQYHPIPENDEWWEKGFTEWTNVTKAVPLFPGHRQPNLPADLGFYDLRIPEVREAQADLARDHGLEAFCYWHYWFGAGKKLLERPFQEVLKTGQPDFPFCLGWANMTWSGIWHGAPDRILIEQTYPGSKDHAAHFYSIYEAFFDHRYVKVDGQPLFVVYAPQLLPEPKSFMEQWRALAVKEGLKGLYFVGIINEPLWTPQLFGLDGSTLHAPGIFFPLLEQHLLERQPKSHRLIKNFFKRGRSPQAAGPKVYDYSEYIEVALPELSREYDQYPCILPNWDNTPRSGVNGYVLQGATPDLFKKHLRQGVAQVENREFDKRLIFVKSWNEWAEGNYLEPDRQFKDGWLAAVSNAVLK